MRERVARSRPATSERGYSFSELLIVVALIGLFVLFGGPSMTDAFRAYKVRSAANDLTVNLRAMRYNAVSTRAQRVLTVNDQANASPNQYSFTNYKGDAITVRLENGVNIETTSAPSITFNINGSIGAGGNQTIVLSMAINGSRNDRYTITVSPSGSISSAYSTF